MKQSWLAFSLSAVACACSGSRSPSPQRDAAPSPGPDARVAPTVGGLAELDAVVAAVCEPTSTRAVHDFFELKGRDEALAWDDFACFSNISPREVIYLDLRRIDPEQRLGPVMIYRMEWTGVERGSQCTIGGTAVLALEVLEREPPHAAISAVFARPQPPAQETTWKSWSIRRTTSQLADGEILCRLLLERGGAEK